MAKTLAACQILVCDPKFPSLFRWSIIYLTVVALWIFFFYYVVPDCFLIVAFICPCLGVGAKNWVFSSSFSWSARYNLKFQLLSLLHHHVCGMEWRDMKDGFMRLSVGDNELWKHFIKQLSPFFFFFITLFAEYFIIFCLPYMSAEVLFVLLVQMVGDGLLSLGLRVS